MRHAGVIRRLRFIMVAICTCMPKFLICALKIVAAEAAAAPWDRRDTLLLVVGRGSSDPDANADVQKLTRLLWEGLGFGWAAACYIGVTTPLLPEAPGAATAWDSVGSWSCRFLFTGVLENASGGLPLNLPPSIWIPSFFCTDYLNAHPLLVEL